MRAVAPAKINLTLEVLGRRDDGFHEIRSVMQTVDIVDEVFLAPSESLRLEVQGDHAPSDDDLVLKAVRTMEKTHRLRPQGLLRLVKQIPAGAGLGGGSSDAAAALRLVDRRYGLGESAEGLARVAGRFSSDGPFFCYGGTALAEGRGEVVTRLPDTPSFWVVVLTPPLSVPLKTRRMYEALEASDFTDGARSAAVAESVRRGDTVGPADVYNAFDRAAAAVFPELREYRERMAAANGGDVHLAGSGPALYTLHGSEEDARAVAAAVDAEGCILQVARSLNAAEATAVDGE